LFAKLFFAILSKVFSIYPSSFGIFYEAKVVKLFLKDLTALFIYEASLFVALRGVLFVNANLDRLLSRDIVLARPLN
jgi:hypothetical protein